MYDPGTKKKIFSCDLKFCENNFENVNQAGEEIREESINFYHDFERDFHVFYTEADSKAEIDNHNLQDLEPVGGGRTLRRCEREKKTQNDMVNE